MCEDWNKYCFDLSGVNFRTVEKKGFDCINSLLPNQLISWIKKLF